MPGKNALLEAGVDAGGDRPQTSTAGAAGGNSPDVAGGAGDCHGPWAYLQVAPKLHDPVLAHFRH